MLELMKKDMLYKLVSIFLAFLLWFYVTNLQNPVIEKTIPVPIAYNGLKEGLVTNERTEKVDVKVKGPSSILNPLTAKEISVAIDLSEVKLGESSFSPKIVPPSGVELVSWSPRTVELQVDAITESQLPIKVNITGAVAPGYSNFEPDVTPSRVVVKGAQQLLSTLDTAQITVDLNQTKENLVLNLPVIILDKNGKQAPVEQLEINPVAVQAYIPVIQNIPTKVAPIRPTIIGKPKEAWRVSRVVLEPETVKITGAYEVLEKVDQIATQPIDITGIEQNLMVQVALTPPEGISLLYQPAVKVLVQVEEAPITRTFAGVPVVAQNIGSDRRATLRPDRITLEVQGPRQEIEALKTEDIIALVDLADLAEGSHQMEVKITLPQNFQVLQVLKVDPGKIEVGIKTGTGENKPERND